MKDDIENSWAAHLGFEPPPSVQQAGILTTRPLSCLYLFSDVQDLLLASFFALEESSHFNVTNVSGRKTKLS